MLIEALFTRAKIWEQLECPSVDEWIEKLWYTYTVEYYAATKMKEILTFCDSMDGPGEYCAK